MIDQFPHCDARILHAPGECQYCDRHPEWQELREFWMVAFTGHEPETYEYGGTQVPCPADFNRPKNSESDHQKWLGNTAKPSEIYTLNITPRRYLLKLLWRMVRRRRTS